MIGHGNAIQEEEDNEGNVLIAGFFKSGTNGNLMDDQDSRSIQSGDCTKPIGIQIHRAQRRSHVRLKHNTTQSNFK